jgi:hypothetical protein
MTPAQKYRELHPDRIRESQRKYRQKHADKLKEREKKYREQNSEKVKANAKRYKENKLQSSPEAFLQTRLQRIKRKDKFCRESAKHKFQTCNLTIEYLMSLWDNQSGRCVLTKKKMTYKFNCLFSVSIDRIDSDKGYVEGNIQLVCQAINYAKNKFTNQEFLRFWEHDES